MELRTLQDWVVTPRMLRCAGVADVENFGGYLKQFTVTFNPAQLAALQPLAERRHRRHPEQQFQRRRQRRARGAACRS